MAGYVLSDGKVKSSVFSGNTVCSDNSNALASELCAMLGAAAGTVSRGRVGVGCTCGPSAEAMKRAFISGTQSTGAQVLDFGSLMESEAVFAISALGLELSVYITGGPRCSVRFLGVGGTAVSNDIVRRMDTVLSSGGFNRCCWNEYKEPADINGIKLLYRRELYTAAPAGLSSLCARPVCDNPLGEQLFKDTLARLGCNTEQGDIYRLSSDGLSLSIEAAQAGIIGPGRVWLLSCGAEFERHNDVVVPVNAPKEIEDLAGRYARRVYRPGADNADDLMARAQYRMSDGIMTAVRLLAFMREKGMTLEQMDMHF